MVNSILKTRQIQCLGALKMKSAIFKQNVYEVLYTLQTLVATKSTPFSNPGENLQFIFTASRKEFLNFSDNGWQHSTVRRFPGRWQNRVKQEQEDQISNGQCVFCCWSAAVGI